MAEAKKTKKSRPRRPTELAQLISAVQGVAEQVGALGERLGGMDERVAKIEHEVAKIGVIEAKVAKIDVIEQRIAEPGRSEATDWEALAAAAYPNGPATGVLRRAAGTSITGAGTRSRGQSGYFER